MNGAEITKQNEQKPELKIEKALQEYTNSVKRNLSFIHRQIDEALKKHQDGLYQLGDKIKARTDFLEQNPTFLSFVKYDADSLKTEQIFELDDIKNTLKEQTKSIEEVLDFVEKQHEKLLKIVNENASEENEVFFQASSEIIEDEVEKKDLNFDRVIIKKYAFSTSDLKSRELPKDCQNPIFPDVLPDVERKKGNESLHDKLLQQIVATDSLEGFRQLMKRCPKQPEQLENKYKDSLYFFNKNKKKGKKSKTVSCNLLVTASAPTAKQIQPIDKLKCYDLLDDVDYNAVKPIQSEYPRRDNDEPMNLKEAKSYLHRMMQESDGVWKKLLQTNEMKTRKRKPNRKTQKLMEYLTKPEHKVPVNPQSYIVMPVKVFYDNFPTKETSILVTDLTKSSEPQRIERKIFPKIRLEEMKKSEARKPEKAKVEETANEKIEEPVKAKKSEQKKSTERKEEPVKAKEEKAEKPKEEQRKQMLTQLKGLKVKNDNIQKNIQKAIDVIETKMIDLLASPTKGTTGAAFNAMEKEISNVLQIMNDTKVVAEKDEGLVAKATPEGDAVVKKRLRKKKDADEKAEDNVEEKVKKSRKREHSCDNATKLKEEPIRKADIEEGEKLLGQVDNVIKKIDSIYTKFYDEAKQKPIKRIFKAEEFLKNNEITATTPTLASFPVLIFYKYNEVLEKIFKATNLFHRASVYYCVEVNYPNGTTLESDQVLAKIDYKQREKILAAVYSLFFSSLFVALSLDYA